jgi:enoyl-CoA hydratase/carnithine racemase
MTSPSSPSGDTGPSDLDLRDVKLPDLTLEVRDRVAVITLDRPEQRNAFTGAMGESLGRAYERCDLDDEIRAVVLTGAGDAFCAGADLGSGGATFGAVGDDDEATKPFTSSPVRPRAWEIRKPVIAAVNGHAIGIGMTLALHCDLRIMATGAKYGIVQVRRGVLGDAHSHWTLPRVAGFAHAADILLTGRHFSAEEAVAMGIAKQALPPAAVLAAALAIADDIAVNTAPLSVALSKKILWSDPPLSAEETDRLETEYHRVVMGREDAKEGVLAYLERRPPQWTLSPTRDWPTRDWPSQDRPDRPAGA